MVLIIAFSYHNDDDNNNNNNNNSNNSNNNKNSSNHHQSINQSVSQCVMQINAAVTERCQNNKLKQILFEAQHIHNS
jgi:hypothetical protein